MILTMGKWALGALLAAGAGAWLWVNLAPDDPARWHVDPATAARTGKPNDHLVAPPGASAAEPDVPSPVWDETPEALMARLDAAAMAEPRTTRLAGSPEAGHVTYVQRSALWGFPDYISVRAVPLDGGAALVLWSRSRYGYSDLGVNAARADRWLAKIGGV